MIIIPGDLYVRIMRKRDECLCGDLKYELYFEESNIEAFIDKLERLYPETEYVNRLMMHSWGQSVVRFYDPDGNLIEVGTSV